ncbi:MAG: Uma2 family endonuclease [Sphingobacteriales bacterium]|nr:MAG: Uma2 family endonuclease [Sphingobacteriales bacterium]
MYTVYDEEKNSFIQVEEPDSSLNYTYADYLKWKFEERLELIKGKIFKMSPAPSLKHQEISMNLSATIYNYLKGKSCKIFSAPFDVRLPVKNKMKDEEITTVVQTDICVICDDSKLDERGCCGAPDLIVEILSPGNSKKEIKIKFELYEEAGVKEYWIINPVEQNLITYSLHENGKYHNSGLYTDGDIITTLVMPGLEINVSAIFEK